MHVSHALADAPSRALGAAVVRARQQRGLTKKALAHASGLSRLTIAQLEAGTYSDLGIRKVQRVLALLGLQLRVEAFQRAARAIGRGGVAAVRGAAPGSRLARLLSARAAERRRRAAALAERALRALARAGVHARIVGSLAKGKFRADSDVDFLVEDSGELPESRVVGILERAMAGFPFDVAFAERMDARLLAIMRKEARSGASAIRQT